MPRPIGCRRVSSLPNATFFKPRGIPLRTLDVITMSLDEFEAIRLADLQGLYQEAAAERMNVSRQTFGRIIDSAHRKVAECLIEGKALEIQGGNIIVETQRTFECLTCEHVWQEPYGTGRPSECPKCHGSSFRRKDAGAGRGHGPGHGGRGHGGPCQKRNRAHASLTTDIAESPRSETSQDI
jgi:uncharacterized protein